MSLYTVVLSLYRYINSDNMSDACKIAIISDFDGTVTLQSTVKYFIEAAAESYPPAEREKYLKYFEDLSKSYTEEKRGIVFDSDISESLESILYIYDNLEIKYSAYVDTLLNGLSIDRLYERVEEIEPQKGFSQFYNSIDSNNVDFVIDSLGWSEGFIKRFFTEYFVDIPKNIYANKLDISNGTVCGVNLRLITSDDKRYFFRKSVAETKADISIYVGDDISDLRAMIEADYAYTISPSEELSYLINRYKLDIKQIATWEEVIICQEVP